MTTLYQILINLYILFKVWSNDKALSDDTLDYIEEDEE